ncbi:MAG: hypothetical protein HOP30_09245 [Cyclobacteriaceae bacterium]|nr:hypothetical protein [Cyclobacteriaceae bacterium]
MATPKSSLINWFKRGLKPLETQFAAWIDSYWHKDESIPQSSVNGLIADLGARPLQTYVDAQIAAITLAAQNLDSVLATGNNANGRRITNLADPTAPQDADTRAARDAALTLKVDLTRAAFSVVGNDTNASANAVDLAASDGQILRRKGSNFGFGNNGLNALLFNNNQGIDAETAGDTLSIGGTNAAIVNIGRAGQTVNILGSVLSWQATNSYVNDQLITLNRGGGAATAVGAGIEIEEASAITGFIKTNASRNGYLFKAPSITNTIEFLLSSLTADRQLTVPNANGTLAISASGNIALSAVGNITFTGILPVANGGTGSATVNFWQTASGAVLSANNTVSGAFNIGFTHTATGFGVAAASITANTKIDVNGISGGNILRLADHANTVKYLFTNNGNLILTSSEIDVQGSTTGITNTTGQLYLRGRNISGTRSILFGVGSAQSTDGSVNWSFGNNTHSDNAAGVTRTWTGLSFVQTVDQSGAGSTVNYFGIDYNPTFTITGTLNHVAQRWVSGNLLVGGTTITTGNVLVDLQSTSRALLLTRVATEGNISVPVNAMIYYNSTNHRFRGYVNSAWRDIFTGAVATGWATPTGTLDRTTFDQSTVTLPQLAQRVAALINDLRNTVTVLAA